MRDPATLFTTGPALAAVSMNAHDWAPVIAGLALGLAVLLVPGRTDPGGDTTAHPDIPTHRDPEREDVAGRQTDDLGERWRLKRGRRTREQPTDAAVADALVLLALGYRSGLPTWQVLVAVADSVDLADSAPTPVSADLRQVAAAMRWGASDVEAWGSVGAVWVGAGRAVAIAHAAGIAPGPLLLDAADDLRRSAVERIELAAAKVGVRLVAPLGLVLLPAFCLTTVAPLVIALGRQLLDGS